MKDNEKKKSKGCGCLIVTLVLGLLFSLFIFLPMIIMLLGGPIVLLNIKGKLGEALVKAEQLVENLGSNLNSILSGYNLTAGDATDLHPLNEDITGGENTCAECKTIFSNVEPKRRWSNISTKSNLDWQYTNFTYLDEDYWDVDFSKFSKEIRAKNLRSTQYTEYDDEGEEIEVQEDGHVPEYLFEWHVNNYNGNKQRFTVEHIHRGTVDAIRNTFDESTRNGSFVTNKDRTQQYLDLGDYLFSAQDSRITSAFAPIVTAGNLTGLLQAKGWFHRGDVWKGADAKAFEGVSLWQKDVGRGTYIDCVFEDNTTHQQIVVPFIYADAKNIHWFESSGQRIDQRYGQCVAQITKTGNNGKTNVTTNILKCKLVKYYDSVSDIPNEDLDRYITQADAVRKLNGARHSSGRFAISSQLRSGDEYVINENWGTLFWNLNLQKPLLFELTDHTIGGLGQCESETIEEELDLYSDQDKVVFSHMTSLELMDVWTSKDTTNISPQQDINYYIAQSLFAGRLWNRDTNNRNPNWSLICMRVYPNKKHPIKDYTYSDFTDLSKSMETVEEIPQNNQVVEFVHDDKCECTMCLKIAR